MYKAIMNIDEKKDPIWHVPVPLL